MPKLMFRVFNLTIPSVPVEKTVADYVYDKYQTFGSDNLFPQHLAAINRQSPVHAGVLANKTMYAIGAGLDIKNPKLVMANPSQTNTAVQRNYISDYLGFGNGTLEIVTNTKNGFVSIYHRDFTKCRVSQDGKSIIQHPKWEDWDANTDKGIWIPLWPEFDVARDRDGKEIEVLGTTGLLRSIFQLKDYSPEFQYYGIPSWISALDAAGIAYKTNKWNLSRLDNGFKNSGVLVLNGDVGEEEAKKLLDEFQSKMIGEGNTGKILFIIKQLGQGATTEFTPFNGKEEGDWIELHKQSEADIITAHNWFRSLSGINDNTGFDTKRILNEYEVAQNTVIRELQDLMLSTLTTIYGRFRLDFSKTTFINKPPASVLTLLDPEKYTRIWEARRMAGMEYDEADPDQQRFVSSNTKSNGTNDSGRSGDRSDQ